MALSTPYLNAHPEYSDLLVRSGVDLFSLSTDEKAELILYDDRRIVWRSGLFKPTRLTEFDSTIRLYSRSESKFRLYLFFKKVHRGYPRQVVIKVPVSIPPPSKDGRVRVSATKVTAKYPDALRKARASVHRQIKSSVAPRSTDPRSTTLRPSSESQNLPYIRVFEGVSFGVYSLSVTPLSRLLYSRTWSGVRTPGYGKLKARRLPVNPHSVTLRYIEEDRIVLWSRNNFKPPTDYNVTIDAFSVKYGEPALPTHIALARNNAVRNLIGKNQLGIEANLAQDFAQLGQTTRLIGHNTRKIARSLLLLKKGNLPGAIKALTEGRSASKMSPRQKQPSASKNLAENWLELQYGWKPLLKDIEGALNSLSALQTSNDFVQRVTASSRVKRSTSSSFNSWQVGNPVKGTTQVVTETRCKFVLRYKIDDKLKVFLAQTGFTNPVNLTWEILPFSFVVDWFLPIGPFLETLSAWDGLQFLDGSETQFTKEITVSAISGFGVQVSPGTDNMFEDHGAYRRTVVKLDRVKLTTFPSQTFPEFKNGLASVDHALNGIALLKAIFGR